MKTAKILSKRVFVYLILSIVALTTIIFAVFLLTSQRESSATSASFQLTVYTQDSSGSYSKGTAGGFVKFGYYGSGGTWQEINITSSNNGNHFSIDYSYRGASGAQTYFNGYLIYASPISSDYVVSEKSTGGYTGGSAGKYMHSLYEYQTTSNNASYNIYFCHKKMISLDGDGVYSPKAVTVLPGESASRQPSITPPYAQGYIFKGYYDDSGTQYINAQGQWVQGYDGSSLVAHYTKGAPTGGELTDPWTDNADLDSWRGGASGASNDPYLISSAEELAGLASRINDGENFDDVYFLQTANIDLSEHQWVPIGTVGHGFGGIYDGNNYTIEGIDMDYSDLTHQGLFGVVYFNPDANGVEGGIIKNVTIASGTVKASSYVGAIAGMLIDGQIINCKSFADVGVYTSMGGTCGGIVGYSTGGTIENCANYGTVTTQNGSCLGGICGYAENSKILRCINGGNVSGNYYIGGLVGESDYSFVGECIVDSVIVESQYGWGAFIGRTKGNYDQEGLPALQDCFANNVGIAWSHEIGCYIFTGSNTEDPRAIACSATVYDVNLRGLSFSSIQSIEYTFGLQCEYCFLQAICEYEHEYYYTANGDDSTWSEYFATNTSLVFPDEVILNKALFWNTSISDPIEDDVYGLLTQIYQPLT